MAKDTALENSAPRLPVRLTSIDAYRGFVMLLMLGEAVHLEDVADKLNHNPFWDFLAFNQSHVEWVGCSLHDMIQPSFSFLVGVALTFSIANRRAKGQDPALTTRHAFGRALILVLLGMFLRSLGHTHTYFTFEDTLTQIGLGYGFLYLLALRSVRFQWGALGAILFGYWLAFALTPLPPAGFDTKTLGVPTDWAHNLTGFAAHWNKNTNLAMRFDVWFLNLFPRDKTFLFNGGGYATLSFIPTLGTMLLGVLAGGVLRNDQEPKERVRWLLKVAVGCLVGGALLGMLGICPVVKRIWTPSWVLFSGGWCFLLLTGFYYLIEIQERKKWAFPLIVVGMNSIAAYVMGWMVASIVREALVRHLGHSVFLVFGEAFEPFLLGIGELAVLWAILHWMYKNKIFLRI